MLKLLKLELYKQIHHAGFWILFALHAVIILLTMLNVSNILNNLHLSVNDLPDLNLSLQQIVQFPDIWQNFTYMAGYFKIIPAIIIITSVTNELASGTARQNIIDGLSRGQWLVSKVGMAKLLAFASLLIVASITLIIGLQHNSAATRVFTGSGLAYLLAYFVEVFVYFIYAIFLALLTKRTSLSIIFLLMYDFIFEPVISWSIPDNIIPYLPMNIIDNLNTFPFGKYVNIDTVTAFSWQQIFVALAYGTLFTIFSYTIIRKRDV